jgi:hypothetical protein
VLVDLLEQLHRCFVERGDSAHRSECIHASRRRQAEEARHRRRVVTHVDFDLVPGGQVHGETFTPFVEI